MKIIGAEWSNLINYLRIECICDKIFLHRADRWRVVCPRCGRYSNLSTLREKYLKERKEQNERNSNGKT